MTSSIEAIFLPKLAKQRRIHRVASGSSYPLIAQDKVTIDMDGETARRAPARNDLEMLFQFRLLHVESGMLWDLTV